MNGAGRVLLLGAGGQLGRALGPLLGRVGPVSALDRTEVDLTDVAALRDAVRTRRPTLIVNAAAYTAVDRAEHEPEVARAVNAIAPAVLAEETRRLGAELVHFSTDYVFDGRARRPYREDDPAAPCGTYGETKREGELAVLAAEIGAWVVRTAWLYARDGQNFPATVRRLADSGRPLRIVDDQVGAPTWVEPLAHALVDALGRRRPSSCPGLYHLTCAGETTWCGLARRLLALIGHPRAGEVEAITTDQYPTPARRPAYSVLDCERARTRLGVALPPWDVALADAFGPRAHPSDREESSR